MPLFYPLGVMKEHQHTRENAGLFDISHMVHIELVGTAGSRCDFTSLPVYGMPARRPAIRNTPSFSTKMAGIIDDLIITRLADDRFLIVANAGCAEKDIAHIREVASVFDCDVTVSCPAPFWPCRGRKPRSVMKLQGFDVADMPFMTGKEPREGWFLSRTGYTGEDGFEIGMPEKRRPGICTKTAGATKTSNGSALVPATVFGLKPGCRFTARTLMTPSPPMKPG